MNAISKIFTLKEKLCCVTLDFEMDYGDRVGEFNIINNNAELAELGSCFSGLKVPVSTFIRTDLLSRYPKTLELIQKIAGDYHCHSHTHATQNFNSKEEIYQTASTFEKYFGRIPLGYRAPQGLLHEGDIELIRDNGFKFSSSVFPSFRPGKFNYLSMPTEPFLYDNGILELPFAVVPLIRYIISLSYLKLIGFPANNALYSIFGLPNVLIFDSHLHDYIVNEESFKKLPLKLRLAWGMNKYSGMKYFEKFVSLLGGKGYKFITMSDLYHRLLE